MMIKEVRDVQYYKSIDANRIHNLLETTFSSLLTTASEFFAEKTTMFGKNFETYFRDRSNVYQPKRDYHAIIELDDHTSLDVMCDYDVNTGEFKNFVFRSVLPRHSNWKSDYFEKISLTDAEREIFKKKEEKFIKELESLGLFIGVQELEFNPETDSLPEALVDIFPRKKDFFEIVNDKDTLKKFLQLYYSYVEDMRKSFEPYEDKVR